MPVRMRWLAASSRRRRMIGWRRRCCGRQQRPLRRLGGRSRRSAGPDAPPAGRSLFDFVVDREADGKRVHDVPFPFEALVQRIEARAGCATRERVREAGADPARPLAAAHRRRAGLLRVPARGRRRSTPSPRAPARPLLKDRLYLGYQEKSDLIEVISYNEAAGRFEFQVVRDYRAGGTPQVVYARRAVCAACHQNLAPIFSRQLWDETNANPRVAARLERRAPDFLRRSRRAAASTFPNAIDAATDRANLLAVVAAAVARRLRRHGAAGARLPRGGVHAGASVPPHAASALRRSLAPAWREDLYAAPARGGARAGRPGSRSRIPTFPTAIRCRSPAGREPRGAALRHVAPRSSRSRRGRRSRSGQRPAGHRAPASSPGSPGFIAAADVRALDEQLTGAPRERPRRELRSALRDGVDSALDLRFKCVRSRWRCARLRVDGPPRARRRPRRPAN